MSEASWNLLESGISVPCRGRRALALRFVCGFRIRVHEGLQLFELRGERTHTTANLDETRLMGTEKSRCGRKLRLETDDLLREGTGHTELPARNQRERNKQNDKEPYGQPALI